MPVFRTVKDAQSGSIRLEAIHQPLYDSASITASGTNQLFSQGSNNRSALATNLQTAGQLSWPKRFSIRALRQVLGYASVAVYTDVAAYLQRATFKVNVGEKNYLTIPAFILTAGTGLEQQTIQAAPALTASTVYANLGRPEQRNIYSLLHSIYLPPVQNFTVVLDIATGLTITAGMTVHLFLEGELLREIQ
jgi:hypothetical protein